MTSVQPSEVVAAEGSGRRWARRPLRKGLLFVSFGAAVLVFAAGLVVGLLRGADATAIALPGWTLGVVEPILRGWGLPPGTVVAYLLVLDCVTFVVGMVGASVLLRGPWSWLRVYTAAVVVCHTALGGVAPALVASTSPGLGWIAGLAGLGWFPLFVLLLVFPDGRFVPAWTRWLVPVWIAVFLGFLALDGAPTANQLLSIVTLGLILLGVAALLYRYLRVGEPQVHRQTGWVVAALACRAGLVLLSGLFRLVVPDLPATAASLALELAIVGASYLVSAILVLTIAVAVVGGRLFDVDVVVNRTVVYAALTVFLLLVFGVVAGAAGLAWQGGGVILPVLATAAAAATLVPVRGWLQAKVARLIYGDRAEPQRMIRELGERLAKTGEPAELLQTLVESLGPALGVTRATITLFDGGPPIARWIGPGQPGDAIPFAIEHRGQIVGRLEVTARKGEPLTRGDRDLLAGVASQAGLAVLAAEAAASAVRARDELIGVREDERRRMYRDLHDGVGPTLASVYQRVELVSRLVDDPDTRQLLRDTGTQLRATLSEVRRMVHALRPTRLDELGLLEALRAGCDELSGPGRPTVELVCAEQMPALPDELELAAYLIVLEAVANAVRHSQAQRCTVTVRTTTEGALAIEVCDDGTGIPAGAPPGTGLSSLRQRAEDVGGRLAAATRTERC